MNKKPEAHEFEGKTLEEAINKGLDSLGLTKENVEIKIIDEGSSGLFGLMGSKPSRIKMIPRGNAEVTLKPQEKRVPAEKKAQTSVKPIKELENSMKDHALKIIKLMQINEEKPEIVFVPGDPEYVMNINFTDSKLSSLLIGKNGKVLRALELIIQSIMNKEFRKIMESIPRIVIDVNEYNLRQKEKIKDMVDEAVNTIKKNGKPFRLLPMAPNLRKYVHTLLQDNDEFETISEGRDDERRVVIKTKHA
ncbi:MAG: hypothetical protein A2252_01005 [Elusimicrobia bacterium RIFOXYA2_FULL_39_19]|nr:MAG: hypothetical protein A2252_01005 [Elusimicrobia bacterium RIFOXYA2_FULL_39_19]